MKEKYYSDGFGSEFETDERGGYNGKPMMQFWGITTRGIGITIR